MADAVDPSHAHIAEQASLWLEKIERTISDDEGRALRQWLASKPHREIIVERCRRWHGPEVLAVLAELVPVEMLSDRVERQYGRLVSAIFLWISVIGLLTVMAAVSKVLPGSDARNNPLRAEAAIATDASSHRTFALPDGGQIVLNAASRLLIDYEPRSRDVTLLSGEALFDARYDAARPFRVLAGGRRFEVEPEGARFNLRRLGRDRVELTVLQGQLRVRESRSEWPPAPVLLRNRASFGEYVFGAGEGGTLGAGWQIVATFSPIQVERRTAWQGARTMSGNENIIPPHARRASAARSIPR